MGSWNLVPPRLSTKISLFSCVTKQLLRSAAAISRSWRLLCETSLISEKKQLKEATSRVSKLENLTLDIQFEFKSLMQNHTIQYLNKIKYCSFLCEIDFSLDSHFTPFIMTNISNLNLSKGTIPPLLKYKIVFLGDQAVGKSSIINRFIYDIFDGNEHRPTIGIDFISQNIFLEDKTVRLQLWDTAGQERFKALIPNYIRDTSVAIIVYDVSNRSSFKSVQKWIDDVKAQRGDGVIIALLANKVDLEERDVQEGEGREVAEKNNVSFKEVSAKMGLNIQQFFKEIAAQLPDVNEPSARVKASIQQQFPISPIKGEAQRPKNEGKVVLDRQKDKSSEEKKNVKRSCC